MIRNTLLDDERFVENVMGKDEFLKVHEFLETNDSEWVYDRIVKQFGWFMDGAAVPVDDKEIAELVTLRKKVVATVYEQIQRAVDIAAYDLESNLNYSTVQLPTLHLTHIDSDAMGCMFVTEATELSMMKYHASRKHGGNRLYTRPIHVMNGNSYLDFRCRLAALVYYIAFNRDAAGMSGRYIPTMVSITDIGPKVTTVNAILSLLAGEFVLTPEDLLMVADGNLSIHLTEPGVLPNWSIFSYIDHHPTNPLRKYFDDLRKVDEIIDPTLGNLIIHDGILVVPTYSEFSRRMPKYLTYDVPMEPNVAAATHDETCKVSATMIGWMMFRKFICKVNGIVDAYESARRLIRAFDAVLSDISQWDTFEWRDHPEFNSETETILVMATPFYENPMKLFTTVLQNWVNIFRSDIVFGNKQSPYAKNDIVDYGLMYPEETRSMSAAAQKIMDKEVATAIRTGVFTTLDVLMRTSMANKEDYSEFGACGDEKVLLIEYPSVSQPSMYVQKIFERFEETDGDKPDIILLFGFTVKQMGLRTTSNVIRLDKIAKELGGGGHPQASGFTNGIVLDYVRNYYISVNDRA